MQRLDAALPGASSVPYRQVITVGADAPGAAYAVTQQGRCLGCAFDLLPGLRFEKVLEPVPNPPLLPPPQARDHRTEEPQNALRLNVP